MTWAAREAPRHAGLRRLGYFGSYARGDWGVGSDAREEWERLRSEGGRFARTIERETIWLAWPILPPGA